LNRSFAFAEILEVFIKFNDGDFTQEKFMEISDIAVSENTCVDSFQLAPDAIVTYINPLDGNEEAIGHNLLEDSERRENVLYAIKEGTVVTQGPVMSRQGKVLIFGRKAIMVDGEFWGLAIVAIDFEHLMKTCGIENSGKVAEYAVAVSDNDNKPVYTWGDQDIIENSSIYTDVTVFNQKWRIAMRHERSLLLLLQEYGVHLVASILVGIAVYVIARYQLKKINSAKMDPLTETYNKLEFQKQVENRLKYSKKSCALLAIDLDKFKYVNDTYGHIAGDEVLIEVSNRMRKAVRKTDLVARVGGDEYMAFLFGIKNREEMMSIIERIRASGEEEVDIGAHEKASVGLSIGYALSPQEGQDYKTLYQAADERMYEDKVQRKAKR
jgi:diguanylate cyclase (GGDEF)-like protein